MAGRRKRLILIVPSTVTARGLAAVLEDCGEFVVSGTLSSFARGEESRLNHAEADAVIVDPAIFAYGEREKGRQSITEHCKAPLIALQTTVYEDDALRLYDGVINICDSATEIVRKVREAIKAGLDNTKSDSGVLSSREKEILVCVARGMQNKEIADLYNLSTYTVISHRKNITRKTGIHSVAGLTVYALLNNLLDINNIE